MNLDILYQISKFGIITIAILYALLFVVVGYFKKGQSKKKLKIAFLHPFCNDGGGGEKVLWFIIKSLIDNLENIEIAIYSLEPNKQQIFDRANKRFNVNLEQSKKFGRLADDTIKIIHVTGKSFLMPQKFLTMIFHIILPMLYSIKCLLSYQPDIFYDTTGYAFTFFAIKLLSPSTKCFAYVHYPFISVDMIEKIKNKKKDYNNNEIIAKYSFLTKLKIFYYQIILTMYKQVKYVVNFCHTNSTWTHQHIVALWGSSLKNNIQILYPPCNVQPLLQINRDRAVDQEIIMSFAQFRPEKRQSLQVHIFQEIINYIKQQGSTIGLKDLKLNIVGAARGADDEKLCNNIKGMVRGFNLQSKTNLLVNKPYGQILKLFQNASYGIHTMQAQHFGISIVEMMAAGLIVVAHNSAGPKMDIIKPGCGFLANNQKQYVEHFKHILALSKDQKKQIIMNARKQVLQFSDEKFMEKFIEEFNIQIKTLL